MSDISYTWEEYIDLNEKLVAMVAKSGWQFDSILCLSRGGMRPGDFFSRVYDMPLAVLATSSYREAKGTVQSPPGTSNTSRTIPGSTSRSNATTPSARPSSSSSSKQRKPPRRPEDRSGRHISRAFRLLNTPRAELY